MCKCPVFNNFCCCCPLKVLIIVKDNIFNMINFMKVGALVIGLFYLVTGLVGGLVCTIFAVTLEPKDFDNMTGVVKIADGEVLCLIK